ncbi:MAG: glycosyltransferase family 9 protein [Flavobacteriales bacterium]
MKKFLIIQTAFLGDAVLATALLEKLHAFHPDAAIDMVVRKGNEGLFEGHPFLRELFVWDKGSKKTRNLFRLIGKLRATRYDHIINCQRFFSTGLMTVLARGGEKIGYDKNPLSFLFPIAVKHIIGDGRHEVERLNALIEHLTDKSRPLPRLYPQEKHEQEARKYSIGAHVCIAPASVWFTKQWPQAKWAELIKRLPADRKVFLIGAPGDAPLCESIARDANRGQVIAGQLSLLGTAAMMQSAHMNYVNDSAPLHIASAMNAAVTAIFCSTIPAFGFGPLRENGRVVETPEKLDCRPCGLHGFKACPKGHFRCALSISSRVILEGPGDTPTHDLEASIRFLTTAEGGKTRAVFTGYGAMHNFHKNGELNDGRHSYVDRETMMPGENGIVLIKLMAPQRNFGLLSEGDEFTVQEAAHIVGQGRILKIFNSFLAR